MSPKRPVHLAVAEKVKGKPHSGSEGPLAQGSLGPPAECFTLVYVLLTRGQTLWPRNIMFRHAVPVTGSAGPEQGNRPLGLI